MHSSEEIQKCITLHSREYLSGPQIAFLNFNFFPLIGGSLSDIPVHAPFPFNVIFIASVKGGNEADSIIFHFANKPDYHKRTDIPNQVKGNEAFIPLTSIVASGAVYRAVVRLLQPVQDFLLDIGTEVGQAPTFTLAVVSDYGLRLNGGIYRNGHE